MQATLAVAATVVGRQTLGLLAPPLQPLLAPATTTGRMPMTMHMRHAARVAASVTAKAATAAAKLPRQTGLPLEKTPVQTPACLLYRC